MAVEVRAGAGFEPGVPRSLFEVRSDPRNVRPNYDVSPDGQRFLVKQLISEASAHRVELIANWPALLNH